MTTDIETELELKQRNLILEVFRNHLDMCLDDLLATFDEDAQEFLKTIPINVLIGEVEHDDWASKQGLVLDTAASASATKPRGKPRKKKVPPKVKAKGKAKAPETASAIEGAVMSFCKKHSPCQAMAILNATQITKSQLRTATKKLIGAGKLALEGAGRGAKYFTT